jgi:hypothetical protein
MIYKQALIKIVNGTLNREYDTAGTELDAKIISALRDVSQRGDFLQNEFKRVTIADRDYYSLPDNFKNLLGCGLKSSDDETMYKDLVFERWAMYRRNIYYSSTSGTPRRYTWMSGFLYPRPIPDAIYNMYWWYSYFHPEEITVDGISYKACDHILFGDIYRKAIELRLLYEVAESLDLDKAAIKYNKLYLLDEIPARKSTLQKYTKICSYRDGF